MSFFDDLLAGLDRAKKGVSIEEQKQKKIQVQAKLVSRKQQTNEDKGIHTKRHIEISAKQKLEVKKARVEVKSEKPKVKEDVPKGETKEETTETTIVPTKAATDSSQRTNTATIISRPKECATLLGELMNSRIKAVAIDCEGVQLGRDGQLCLIQMAFQKKFRVHSHNPLLQQAGEDDMEVYLFDIVEGGTALFEEGRLREFLEYTKIVKILHDCRRDSDALFHQFGVKLENVWDTQIAYALYCRQQGQGTPLPIGMNTLLKKYTPSGVTNQMKDLVRKEMETHENYWVLRPMSYEAIEYAAQDVIYLPTLYRKLDAMFTLDTRARVADFSDVYVRQIRDSAVPKERFEKEQKEREMGKENETKEKNENGGKVEEVKEEGVEKLDVVIKTENQSEEKKQEVPRKFPTYGIKEWDMDAALRMNARRRRT